jgi:ABC-type glycerol-3-phosphate transport system substrate-binding protein
MRQLRTMFLTMCLLSLAVAPVFSSTLPNKVSIALYDVRMKELDEASIARFRAANPDVEVDIVWTPNDYAEKMLTMFAAGVMPDILNRDVGHRDAAEFQHRGTIIDLQKYVAANRSHFQGWLPGIIEGAYKHGILPAIPRPSIQTYVLYYNLDHFGAAGLPFPDGRWDWDGFRQASKRLTKDLNGDGKIDVFAYDKSWNYWQPILRNNGAWRSRQTLSLLCWAVRQPKRLCSTCATCDSPIA